MITYNLLYGGYSYLNENFNTRHSPVNLLLIANIDKVSYKSHINYQKIHLISFASTDSMFSKARFVNESASFGFKYIKVYSEKDFSDDYLLKYRNHFKDKRGFGYWSWKSYIIKKELNKLSDDEYLVYADCGSSFNSNNLSVFEEVWIKNLNDSVTGILCPGAMLYLEMNWNKADCVNYINERYHTDLLFNDLYLKLNAATVILFRPTLIAKQIVDEWFDICNNHYDLITDKPSEQEQPYLKEHRHDLSVFSLLAHIYKITVILSNYNGIDDKTNAPIYALKTKNDKEEYMNKLINNNVDIFICTHKDFDVPYNYVYKIICGKGLIHNNYPMTVYEDNYNENSTIFLKEYSYAEGSRINYIRHNIVLKDYVGIVHYRKYFKFTNNPEDLPDFNQIFKNYDIVLLDALYGNLFGMYNVCHFGEHLKKCIEIGRELFPDYNDEFDKAFLDKQRAYYCNMFVMKKDDFYKMCDFVYGILSKFDEEMNFNTDEDIHKWVEQNIGKTRGQKNVNYQSRVDGFLTERLFSIWVWHNFSLEKIYTKPLNVIGNYQVTYKKTLQ